MKKAFFLPLLFATLAADAQVSVQPVASGDYWLTSEYRSRLPQLGTKAAFPMIIRFANGAVGITELYANRLSGENEIIWNTGAAINVSRYVIEWSRDGNRFEHAGEARLDRVEGGRHVFLHPFTEDRLVYYRLGIVGAAGTVAYTPAVQVTDVEQSTKVFPTLVKGGAFYVQTGRPYEVLQVLNSSSQRVYEKGINGVTGTVAIILPSKLPGGVYFVRLLNSNQSQHVQRVLIE